jgi:hypothetical protein
LDLAVRSAERAPCTINVSQIRITALADTEQSILTTRTVLPRCQSQRGGKLSAIGKLMGITESDDERCGDHWTDTAQLLKANGGRLVCRDSSDLAVELAKSCHGCVSQPTTHSLRLWRRFVRGYKHRPILTPWCVCSISPGSA